MKPLFRGNSLTLTGCFQWMVAFLPCCCLLPGLPVPSVVENYFQMQYEGHTQTIIFFFFANMLLILWMFSSKWGRKLSGEVTGWAENQAEYHGEKGHAFGYVCGPELLWKGWGKKSFTLVGTTHIGKWNSRNCLIWSIWNVCSMQKYVLAYSYCLLLAYSYIIIIHIFTILIQF